jgi:hypothetical protein
MQSTKYILKRLLKHDMEVRGESSAEDAYARGPMFEGDTNRPLCIPSMDDSVSIPNTRETDKVAVLPAPLHAVTFPNKRLS